MKKTMLMAALALVMTTGCGGAVKVGGGKAGAANALAAASKPTRASANRAATPIDLTPLAFDCPHGGKAALTDFTSEVSGNASGGSVTEKFTVTYTACGLARSEAGVALYDGTLTVSQAITGTATGGTVEQHFTGRVAIHGAFDDFLETDVTQSISASTLGADSGSMKLVGTLTNSGGTYTYDESLSVTGDLPVASVQATK